MKYCTQCGAQILEEAVVCPNCGCANAQKKESGIVTAAKVFFILGTIVNGFLFLPALAWCIPMSICYWNKMKRNEPISTGFKVCTLLFVSLVGGILMLCDKDH